MRKQKGFTGYELLGVIVVGMLILSTIPGLVQVYQRDVQAKALAGYIAEYNGAVGRWLQDNRTVLPNGTTVMTGPDWLKDATACSIPGGAALNYLPCNFQTTYPFGVTVTTDIVVALPLITATSTFGPAVRVDGQVDQPLINQILAEARARSQGGLSVSQSFTIDPATDVLVAIVDTNDPGDPWLLLDGTSVMTGDLDMGGNNINNVGDINATGDITTTGDMFANLVEAGDVNITSINESASDGVYNIAVVFNGSIIAKPTCLPGKSALIFLAPFQFSGNTTAEPVGAVQTWAVDNGASWTANLRILHPDPVGWVLPTSEFGKMNATTKCG